MHSFIIMIYQEKNYRRSTPKLTNCVTCFRLSSYLPLYSRSSSSFCSTWCWRLAIAICSWPPDGEPLAMLSPAFLAPTLERSLFYKMEYDSKTLCKQSSSSNTYHEWWMQERREEQRSQWMAYKWTIYQFIAHRWH